VLELARHELKTSASPRVALDHHAACLSWLPAWSHVWCQQRDHESRTSPHAACLSLICRYRHVTSVISSVIGLADVQHLVEQFIR
jgi:hypothetical protein